jgi:hypothetical protein
MWKKSPYFYIGTGLMALSLIAAGGYIFQGGGAKLLEITLKFNLKDKQFEINYIALLFLAGVFFTIIEFVFKTRTSPVAEAVQGLRSIIDNLEGRNLSLRLKIEQQEIVREIRRGQDPKCTLYTQRQGVSDPPREIRLSREGPSFIIYVDNVPNDRFFYVVIEAGERRWRSEPESVRLHLLKLIEDI